MYIIQREVVKYALSLIGQQEKPNNSGFLNAWFEKLMLKVGWRKYDPWCAYFAELVWKYPYEKIGAKNVLKKLDRLFSPSAVQTYKNFKKAGYKTGMKPIEGALAVWQTYKNGKHHWSGHIGVVVRAMNHYEFYSVEGNTNDKGGREGYIVAKREHSVLMEQTKKDGLRFIGFVYLKDYIMQDGTKKTPAYEY